MTDKWQAGRTYTPGSLVVPTSKQKAPKFVLNNGDFGAGSQGWDYSGGVIFEQGTGYGSPNNCVNPGSTGSTGEALNTAHLPINPGGQIYAECMIMQGASDADHTRGWVVIRWYDSSDTEIGTPALGNEINDGSGGAWLKSSVTAPAPANCAYARAGIRLYQNSADKIAGDNLVVKNLTSGVPTGLVYKATQENPGKSGATEPDWPGAVGVEVQDNEVTWEGVIGTAITWEAVPLLVSGDTEPTWPTQVGANVRDVNINWKAISRRIEDPNCPNSKVVAAMASKIFAADGDIVRFCATVNPLDWTSEQDAGYLPTGLQQANSNDVAVLAPYRGNLAVFNASSFQLWQVDPDPSAMALLDQMEGIGSTHQKAAHAVGNDLFYLSQLGVRSVSVSAASDNLEAGDVGMPIDPLVQASLKVATANSQNPVAAYYPSAGQFWLAFHDLAPLTLSGNLPDGHVGDTVDFTYTTKGGLQPVTLSITSGSLPDGLTMDDAGHVTGTLTTDGDYSWTVQAKDASEAAVALDDGAEVTPVPLIISGTFPDAKAFVPYSEQLTITGGLAPYSGLTVSSGSLPGGLALSLQGDKIALIGTPTSAVKDISFMVEVSSADSKTADSPQTMSVTGDFGVLTARSNTLRVFSHADSNFQQSQVLTLPHSVRSMWSVPSQKLAFVAYSTGTPAIDVLTLDDYTGFSISEATFNRATTGNIYCVASNADASTIVLAGAGSSNKGFEIMERDGTSLIWNSVLAVTTGDKCYIARFSPDGSTLVVGSSNPGNQAAIYTKVGATWTQGDTFDGQYNNYHAATTALTNGLAYVLDTGGGGTFSTISGPSQTRLEYEGRYSFGANTNIKGNPIAVWKANVLYLACQDGIVTWRYSNGAMSVATVSAGTPAEFDYDNELSINGDGTVLLAASNDGIRAFSVDGQTLTERSKGGLSYYSVLPIMALVDNGELSP